jgi:hypothetical protein
MATPAGCISNLSQLSILMDEAYFTRNGTLIRVTSTYELMKIHIIFKKHDSNSSLQYTFEKEYLAIPS